MYLTIKQHDKFHTLLMGFEVPYIAGVITRKYRTADAFVGAMKTKNDNLSATAPKFLRDILLNISKLFLPQISICSTRC